MRTDEAWFEELYETYHRRIWTYYSRRAERRDVDDLAHETFIVAWRKRATVPSDDPLPWLFAVSSNLLRNHRRARRPTPALVPDRPDLETPETRVVERDAIVTALEALSATDRDLLTLTAWEQLSPAQVAEAVGIAESTVAVRLHRARRRLEEIMRAASPPSCAPLGDVEV